MPDDPPTLLALLAELYPYKTTVLVKASEGAGIPPQKLDTDGAAEAVWGDVLRKAAAAGKVAGLVALASREFPKRAGELAEAAARFASGLAGPGAPFRVPFLRNPGFVGREDDLARLHELLQKGGPVGVRPAALTGMGGIGKTQLAVEYAHRYAAEYPGGVYWVNAAEPLQAELARLAIEAGLGAGEASGAERTQRLALAFAKHLRERPGALAIFDNVEDPLALRSAGPGFVPEQLGCRLLFTTRRRDPPRVLPA